jgi:hypothetical protein
VVKVTTLALVFTGKFSEFTEFGLRHLRQYGDATGASVRCLRNYGVGLFQWRSLVPSMAQVSRLAGASVRLERM